MLAGDAIPHVFPPRVASTMYSFFTADRWMATTPADLVRANEFACVTSSVVEIIVHNISRRFPIRKRLLIIVLKTSNDCNYSTPASKALWPSCGQSWMSSILSFEKVFVKRVISPNGSLLRVLNAEVVSSRPIPYLRNAFIGGFE